MRSLETAIPLWVIVLGLSYCGYKLNPEFKNLVDTVGAPVAKNLGDRLNLPDTEEIKEGFCSGYSECE